MVGIYKIVNPKGKIYIGQSVDCLKRKATYSRGTCSRQPKLYNSIKKYGWNKHTFEIIQECNREELSKLEKYYVDLFNTFNSKFGLNVRDGGGNLAYLSQEQKIKISNSLKGKKHTPERVEKNRIANSGKKASEETKLKISIALKGKMLGIKLSEEHRKKISNAKRGKSSHMKGKTHSQHTRELIRQKTTGVNNANFGKPRSANVRAKISEAITKYWALKNEQRRNN